MRVDDGVVPSRHYHSRFLLCEIRRRRDVGLRTLENHKCFVVARKITPNRIGPGDMSVQSAERFRRRLHVKGDVIRLQSFLVHSNQRPERICANQVVQNFNSIFLEYFRYVHLHSLNSVFRITLTLGTFATCEITKGHCILAKESNPRFYNWDISRLEICESTKSQLVLSV